MDIETETSCLELDLGSLPKEKDLKSFPQSKMDYGSLISEKLLAHF